MKTGLELLRECTDAKLRLLIIKNTFKGDSTNVRSALSRQFPGFSEYISYSFTWSSTSEGDDFWRNLHRHSAVREEGCI